MIISVQEEINAEPVDDGAEENKEMPEEMGAFPLQGEGDHAYGIDDAAGEGEDEERQVFPDHAREKDQADPSQHDKKHRMKHPRPSGTEDRDKRDTQQDHRPLDTAEDCAHISAPEKQPHGGEGAADEQVDGAVVEDVEDALRVTPAMANSAPTPWVTALPISSRTERFGGSFFGFAVRVSEFICIRSFIVSGRNFREFSGKYYSMPWDTITMTVSCTSQAIFRESRGRTD